jgi:hypothetical protein
VVDHACRAVPTDLTGQWTFVHGDVRSTISKFPRDIGYLFVDAAHTASFARWYLAEVFPKITPGTQVSVHDVFHGRRPMPLSEGAVVTKWLAEQRIDYVTAARKAAPDVYERLMQTRRRLGIDEPIHDRRDNPMIFFRL